MANKETKPAASANSVKEALQSGESGEVAVVLTKDVVPLHMPGGVKLKRQLTLSTLNLSPGAGCFIRVDTNPVVSDVRDKSPNAKDAAIVADVSMLRLNGEKLELTGESFRWLVPSVALGNFLKSYAASPEAAREAEKLKDTINKDMTRDQREDTMRKVLQTAGADVVGKYFAVQNMGKRTPSQRYWDYNLAEVELG